MTAIDWLGTYCAIGMVVLMGLLLYWAVRYGD